MKKILSLSCMSIALVVLSCNNQPEDKKVTATPPVVIKTDPVIVVKDAPEKTTSVTLDKSGVKVETKKVVVIKH